jgi:hypothetical protein
MRLLFLALSSLIFLLFYVLYILFTQGSFAFLYYSFLLSILWLAVWIIVKKITANKYHLNRLIPWIPILLFFVNLLSFNSVGKWAPHVEFFFRKQQLTEEISEAKRLGKDLKRIQWRPWSGESGPLFIYSESPLPTGVYIHYPDYTSKSNNTDCEGGMYYLGENFYIFSNQCY